LDMTSAESPSRNLKIKSLANSGAERPPSLETASGLYGALLEKVCGCLRKWMNDFATSSFALDVLCGMANAPVPQPNIALCKLTQTFEKIRQKLVLNFAVVFDNQERSCRRCVQSVCDFIVAQCQREKKDHTRSLHSLIINAFNCLSVWIVAHPFTLHDLDTLKAVVETTKLGGRRKPKKAQKRSQKWMEDEEGEEGRYA
uniref:Neurofibromin n=1 Tax=Rodentolepis nana TaxID=102285 RepID=A0A0R3TZG3_RODNA